VQYDIYFHSVGFTQGFVRALYFCKFFVNLCYLKLTFIISRKRFL